MVEFGRTQIDGPTETKSRFRSEYVDHDDDGPNVLLRSERVDHDYDELNIFL